jgi:molybdopterin molybdotransferase
VLTRGFETLTAEAAALGLLLDQVTPVGDVEELWLDEADGRTLASPLRAGVDLPGFDRSAMDGWAVRAEDTAGATAAGPVRLRISAAAGPGTAVAVHTGAPVPHGADAVLPVEDAERADGALDVVRRLRVGENVGRRGEDVAAGEELTPAGLRLRPQDLALLRAGGVERVPVVRTPRVRVVPTGEELVPPGTPPGADRTIDSNGVLLAALAARWGALPDLRPVYSDDPLAIADALEEAAGAADLVLTSGGTSVGERDQVVEALARAGEVAFHGVAIQPARPVAAGTLRGAPVLCLPGSPAAAFVAAFAFLRPALARLGGHPLPEAPRLRGRLARKIVSTPGLRSYTRVRIAGGIVEPVRTSGAGILSSLVRANGFVVTPEEREGEPEGAEVEVLLF